MSREARVYSIEAVRRFRLELQKYQNALRQTVEHLMSELRRGRDWLDHDRPQYWKQQTRNASNRLSEALSSLECCLLAAPQEIANPCQDERIAVERAKQRQRYAEKQIETTKKWARSVQQQGDDFESHVARLQQYAEHDLTRAIAQLMRIETSLAKYAEQTLTRDPSDTGTGATGTGATGTGATGTGNAPTADRRATDGNPH